MTKSKSSDLILGVVLLALGLFLLVVLIRSCSPGPKPVEPTLTPSLTPFRVTSSPTPTVTAKPTDTPTPTATAQVSPSATRRPTSTKAPTSTPAPTLAPTQGPRATISWYNCAAQMWVTYPRASWHPCVISPDDKPVSQGQGVSAPGFPVSIDSTDNGFQSPP